MVKADMTRIHRCFNHIAKALYYHEYKEIFSGKCTFLHDWTIQDESNLQVKIIDGNKERRAIEHVLKYFDKLEHNGENALVFRYRFEEPVFKRAYSFKNAVLWW